MEKLRLFVLCVSMFIVPSMPALADTGFSYVKNTFIKYYECLGVYPGTSLKLQEGVWIFSLGQSPARAKVSQVVSFAEAKKRLDKVGVMKASEDKQLWAEVNCASLFSGDRPEAVVKVTPEPTDSWAAGFAIRNLPAGAWVAGGKGESVSLEMKNNPFVKAVRHLVTDTCFAPDSLIRVKQFPVKGQGRAITQLDIGKVKKFSPEKRRQVIEEKMQLAEEYSSKRTWPDEKKRVLEKLERKVNIESVDICRFYLDGNRVLKSENIFRSSGEDERVDTPTDLDADNWADATDSAIGFISLNEGKDWEALFVDVGFEGILYSIQRLNDSVEHYRHDLYTYH